MSLDKSQTNQYLFGGSNLNINNSSLINLNRKGISDESFGFWKTAKNKIIVLKRNSSSENSFSDEN